MCIVEDSRAGYIVFVGDGGKEENTVRNLMSLLKFGVFLNLWQLSKRRIKNSVGTKRDLHNF